MADDGKKEEEIHVTLRKSIPIRYRKIFKYTFRRASRIIVYGGSLLSLALWLIHAEFFFGVSEVYFPVIARWGIAAILTGAFMSMVREILFFVLYFYDIQGNNIIIRKGVIAKTEVILAFSRITDVYVDQDLWDAVLFLYDVHISTPTAMSLSIAHINGLNRKDAMELKQMILERINRSDISSRSNTGASISNPPNLTH